ncbi:uncharacterized protein LOC121718953 [Alosa sapidissima]|uniref:uncharacterized protein LOC121718951 n=1 Tax=Alosa sapidissima TaxID=34773 RepID=UPI001C08CE61|nr:uncharacterized protein LOC121718951 [Alosa sapidissima]XP_041960344.1 uncharacterized protein LOC121718952 [Alosa sapidissima]XP_041960345.1 uncharacterized protein LOC121718953 [Alosa sapidissima]
MEDQVRLLTEQIKQLQADNERLQQGNVVPPVDPDQGEPSRPVPGSSGMRYVYVPRERKYPKFSGTPGTDCPPVEEWVEEVRKCLQARHMSSNEQAYFVYDLLEGEAKLEIKLRPATDRADPEKIVRILSETFGCTHSYIEAQQKIFQCRQREGETVREFSHSLMALMEICQRKNSNALSNPDSVLRDQFVENVRDKMLRRELKQFIRLNPVSTFLDVRREAFRWADDGEGGRPLRARAFSCDASSGVAGEWGAETQAVAAKTNDELAELKDCLRRQQAQLDTILKHLSSGPVPSNPNSRPSNPPRRYRFEARLVTWQGTARWSVGRDSGYGVTLGRGQLMQLMFNLVGCRETSTI